MKKTVPRKGPTGSRVIKHAFGSGNTIRVECADGTTARGVWTGKAWHWTDCT